MRKADMISKMIDFYQGSVPDIDHFLKVYAYAAQIGHMEQVDDSTQEMIEMSAIVHDISCPLCRKKYGKAYGNRQEEESEALLRPFLAEFDLTDDQLERLIYLVCHHHTFTKIDGMDYQILVEADLLVNISEGKMSRESIETSCSSIVRTAAGKKLFEMIFFRQ